MFRIVYVPVKERLLLEWILQLLNAVLAFCINVFQSTVYQMKIQIHENPCSNDSKKNNFNLYNFKQIRGSLSDAAALMFLHSMILSHLNYCMSSWSMSGSTILKPVELLYKKALKTPFSYHHCNILEKYDWLSFIDFSTFSSICLIYKVLHGLAPPPLQEFINYRQTRITRAVVNRDCEVPFRIC